MSNLPGFPFLSGGGIIPITIVIANGEYDYFSYTDYSVTPAANYATFISGYNSSNGMGGLVSSINLPTGFSYAQGTYDEWYDTEAITIAFTGNYVQLFSKYTKLSLSCTNGASIVFNGMTASYSNNTTYFYFSQPNARLYFGYGGYYTTIVLSAG